MCSSNSGLPFLDLNLYPDPSLPVGIFPKIEPKEEPFDDEDPVLLVPNNNPFPVPPESSSVYSEFDRISQLFNSAFAERKNPEPNSSLALVPVNPEKDTQVSNNSHRSSELVRVTDLKPEDKRHFRESVRKTRILYESLRVFSVSQDDKHKRGGGAREEDVRRRSRTDYKAASLLRDRCLWLNRDKRIVGHIPGIAIGDVFFFRMEMCVLGLHGQPQAGIDYVPAVHSSNGEPIATSIIVSGGYEDDEDGGEVVIYTGHGGQDRHFRQVVHQKLEQGNLAMERSMNYGVEVRVVRGFKLGGGANGKVYVYDGLYKIVDTWFDVGKSGFGVYKFKLVRIQNQAEMGSSVMKLAERIRTRPLEARPNGGGYVSLDLSNEKENLPITFFNDVDQNQEPLYYSYITTTIFPQYVYTSGSKTGCECVGESCLEGCFCAIRNGGEFAYDLHGILIRGKPLIFECGPHCSCPPTCRNRVAQKGVRHRFEVFRSKETGWGVRSLDLIQAGSFLCEYAGLVLTREQVEIFTMNGDSLIYPTRFSDRWSEWGDLSSVFSDYVRPTQPSVPPLDFAMDVSRMRNVACYMSHSSSPNVMVQLVMYDHNNVSFPHLMLFAIENIPPMRELSLDYGVADEASMGKPKLAICS